MKKVIALVLVLVMVLSLSTVAFAKQRTLFDTITNGFHWNTDIEKAMASYDNKVIKEVLPAIEDRLNSAMNHIGTLAGSLAKQVAGIKILDKYGVADLLNTVSINIADSFKDGMGFVFSPLDNFVSYFYTFFGVRK